MKTLHTIYSTFAKHNMAKFLTVLTILFTVGIGQMWGAEKTITLTYSDFGLTTSYAQKTATVDGVGFTVNQGYKGTGDVIQMNSSKGNGVLYNTTSIPGLKSITVNVFSGSKTYTITSGTAQTPSGNSQTGTTTKTFSIPSGDTYFQLKVSGASYFSSIVITYDDGNSGSGSDGCTWELVTDASTLAAGDRIVIAASGENFAISTTQNNNNRAQAEITKSNDKKTISAPGSTVQIITLEAGTESGTLAFNVGSGYLYAASSGSNYLRTEETLSSNSSWEITIESTGVATIIAQGTNTRNWLRYNSGSNIFSCYNSGQNDVVIYKEICAKEVTVTLDPAGGTGTFTGWTADGDNYTMTVDANTEITLPELSKTGYNFDGWHDGKETVTSPYTPTTDITLTAKWTAIEYTITYNDTKGATNSNPTTYTIEDEISFAALTDLPKGYNFTGWNPASIAKGTTGNQTVTAQWTAIEYTITYQETKGATNSNPDTYTIEDEITFATLTDLPKGYNFTGWNPASIAKGTTGNQTVTAQWTAIEYTITYQETKGATNSNPDTYTIEDEITFAALTNLPKGYNFTGWNPASIAKNTTGNQTVTAQWTEKALTRYRTDCDACIPLDGYASIDGTYHFFPGETITLTVTPPADDVPYTYQWQKKVNSDYEDIEGETGLTYTKENATTSDVGHYRCVVSSEGYCDLTPEFDVKCLQLYVYYDNKSDVFNTPLNRGAEENTATISVDLQNANYKYYFKITDGCGNWYGFNGDIHSGWCTDVPMDVNEYCGLQTTKFGTYVFNVNYSDLAHLTVSVIYPAALQEVGKEIYLDNNVLNWTHSNNADGTNKIYYRIGRGNHNNKTAMTLVPGTANLYKVTTSKYDNFEVWHIANNGCHSESNSIFKTKTNDKWAATQATAFETLPVTLDAVTVTPTTLRSVGGDENNNNCEFYNYNITEGMKTWNAEVIEPTNGTITVKYTHHDGAAVNDFTSDTRNLAHTCLLTITATPNVGYSLASLTVNDEPFNSGDVHTLTANAVIKAEFTINTHTVTWKLNGGNIGGDESDIVQEYEYGAAIEAPEKPTFECYEFVEWTPTYNAEMTMPDEDLVFTATWNKLSYNITFQNWDGSELQSSTVECGETPSYTGATPTREQTAQYTYTFKGWSPTIAPATQDQVYTAQFNQTTRSYTVIWYDGTGNAHKTQTENYNTTVALPTTNPDPCDDDYPYFIGWTADPIVGSTTTQPELVENVKVTGDCDYYAVFAKGEAGENGSYTLDYEVEGLKDSNKWGSYGTSYSHTANDGSTWVIKAYKNLGMQINTGKNASIKIPTCPSPITSIEVTGTASKAVGLSASDYTGSETITYIASGTDATNQTLDLSGESVTGGYIVAKSGSISITKVIVNFGAQTEYTSFITTCCTSWTAPTLTYPTELEENGTAMPQLGAGTTHGTVTYASSNPSILSVNPTTGQISAQAPGTATVTATWSGDETYCSVSSTSNVITVKGSFSVIYNANGGTGTMANQKADENNKIAQLNANQFTRTGYAFVGWNTSSSGTGTAYIDQQTNITLAQNLTLYAQWAPVVTLNDAGSEETAHPTAVNGTITLPDGANACEPYEFVGWTSVATADWNGEIEEPELVTSPYKPTQPTTLYAVYKIQDEGNPNAFKLSFEGSNGKTYYVGEYGSSPYIRGYSNITKEEAVTFIRTKMYPNDDTRYYVYMEEKGEYLYYNGTFNSTSTPDENQGWIFHTVGDQIKLQSTYSYDPEYLSFSDRDNNTINMGTNASGSLFNMLPAVTSTYVAAPLCNQEITITFETGNGDFVANAPDTNPLTVNQGETITLPTCEYPGYEFMGWLKDEQQPEPSDIPVTYYTGDYTVSGISSSITFYAYYKAVPEEVEFTGTDDAELLMYYYDGTANYYYASSFDGGNGELPSMQNCFNATTWTFTNVGNMQYHIQDETGKYLGAVNDNDNDLSLSNTPKVWNFTLVNGLWKMVCEDSPSRALMYISTGKKFTNAAISNEGNGSYSYITLGICPYPTYTTNPVLSQGFSITNTAMVTSASGQKVKATSALTLETRNIELPCTFTIAAPNITFYDNTGAEVTQLTASAASEQFELHFAYKPTAENTMEYPTITITDDELKTYTIKNRIYARSLPATFAIVAKVGNIWYALPSQGLNSTTPPAAYPVEVDNQNDPTAVTAVPENADWSLRGVYEASRSDATKDRYVANGDNLVFVNNASPAMTLNASSSENYLLTDAQYNNYYSTNPGLYEWTPTTTDLETYQLTNEQRSRTLSVNTATVFGVHAQDKAVEQVRFLPIQNRYTPAALQVVEWKENSVVIMYNGDPAQTASVSVNGAAAQNTTLSAAERDIAVYELTADGLAANPTQRLSITIGTEKVILSIPYIISGDQTDLALLPGSTVAARQEVAKVSDMVILKGATLTADGAKGNPYNFRNVTIYGGGKLVIPSEAKGFGVASLTLRAGGITDAGEYDYVYPQFELRGTFTNSAAKINYDYITDYDHWFHLVLPFAGDLTIKYPTEFYGANVAANNKGSWQIKRYAGEIRATGNYNAWVDIETEGETSTTAGQGYIFWGAPKKVSVNGGASTRQKWGIQRITMSVTAPNAMIAENGDKAISELSSYANVPNNSGKDNDQGWNLIGNPYMVNLTDMATTGLHACKLVEVIDPATGKWNGQWEWNDETNIRYLTIPSEHFDTYTAKTLTQAVPLVAGRAFFIQLEGEANGITFAAANRASLMPALRAANDKPVDIETGIILSNETLQDEVNFWIKDGKTNDYEYNADYPKTPNNNQFNIYGVHTNGDLSWVATGPEYAAESMPIGYQVPAAGTYMLSLSEIYNSDGLDALYVTDHALSPEVTVDIMSEPYEFSVNQAETNNERFTVSVRVKAKTENGATGLGNVGADGEQIHKFIYQDKIFILHHGVIYDATGKRVITINK